MTQFLSFSEGLSLEELMGIKGGNSGTGACQAGSVGYSCNSEMGATCPQGTAVKCESGSVGMVIVKEPDTDTRPEPAKGL